MLQLLGFAPDADPQKPGVIVDCSNIIPDEIGMRAAPATADIGANALVLECRGAAAVTNLSGAKRLIAGTAQRLYELGTTTWSDASTGTYSLNADDRWSFVQFGDTTLAATITERIKSSNSGTMTTIASAPFATIVEAASGFGIAFNTSTSSDEWYCSAYLDVSDWTLNASTQCVKGRLVGGTGPIMAARRFGDDVVAYKQGAMFLGKYVGAPEVWRWQQVSNDVGCVGQMAVVDTPQGHLIVGRDSLYLFDGTTPKPIGVGVVRKWLFDDMAPNYQYKTQVLFDRANHRAWIFYCSSTSSTIDRCLVYHVLNGKFGRADQAIEAIIHYHMPSLTYAGGGSITTYESGPAIPYDALFWISGRQSPGVFNSSHKLCTLTGAPGSGSFTTGDFGADEVYSFCRALRVRYTDAPTTSTVTGYRKDASGDDVGTYVSNTQVDGRHNLRQRGRWHRFKVATTGDFQVTGVLPELVPGGTR